MHISKYTFSFSVEDGKQVLLFNPLTTALDLVEKQSLKSLYANCREGKQNQISDETLSYMVERGYLYDTPEDEEAALLRGFEEYKDRERRSNMRFVILPTYQCNSRCSYCFIGDAIGQESLMTDETMDLAFAAIDSLADEIGNGCTKQLSLFGGEPLIDSPAQRRVVERILQKAAERRLLIDVVSNGFDLTYYADLLKQYGVSKVQVTFDGMREYHNTRRRAVDGRGPSFDRIVAGVDAALAVQLPLNVRILLDKNSVGTLPELVRFFKEKHWFDAPTFSVHLGSVFDCFRCQPAKETAKHLTVQEGNETLYKICTEDRSIADLLQIDWQGIRRFLYTGKLFPATYKTCFGGTRMFAFDMNGGIYACETTAGRPEYQIGRFVPELALNRDLMKALDERNILNIPECRKCPQALLCAGGCTFNAVVTRGSLLAPGCRMLKETLQYGLDYYWPEIKTQMHSQDAYEEALGSNQPALSVPPENHVKSFYAKAAQTPQVSLCCPQKYSTEMTSHIPEEVLERSYGCGSPVTEADVELGSVVVDLGCGAGIDAFLAARRVGASGRVIGIDMTDEMIMEGQSHAAAVAEKLGYDVVEFRLGRLEELPIDDNTADLVLSNCALNLSTDKSRVLSEIFRILKPGGRFVISDIIAERHVPEALTQDPDLWNQCVSGAFSLAEFTKPACDAGFIGLGFLFEDAWQQIQGIRFYPGTLKGYKPRKSGVCVYQGQQAIYTGPFSSAADDDGHIFPRGVAVEVCSDTARALSAHPYTGMFLLVEPGNTNASACCAGNNTTCN